MSEDKTQMYTRWAEAYLSQIYSDGQFISERAIARKIEKSRATAKHFTAWLKEEYLPKNQNALPSALDTSKTWEKDLVTYTDLGDEYGGIFSINRDDFDSLRKDYSRYWGGGASSQSEIVLKYRFPSLHAFEKFKKIHALRQNNIPFSDQELYQLGVDDAVSQTMASLRQDFFAKLQTQIREEEKKDAEKWRALEVNARSIVAQVNSIPQAAEPNISDLLQPPCYPYAAIISLTDLHLGKLAYDIFGQKTYDREEASRRALAAVRDLLKQILILGRPEEIILVLGSDGIDVDSPAMKTTSGTSLAGQTEGTYREIVEQYLSTCKEIINTCRAISKVKALVVEGNHDQVSSMLIGLVLEQLYSDDPQVEVKRQMADGVIFLNYAENSLLFAHGESLRSLKDIFKIINGAAQQRFLPLKDHKFSFSGHLHHERTEDLGGIKHHLLPALCEPDEYHRRKHYSYATAETVAFIIRKTGGKSAVFYSDPNILNARNR